MNNCHWPSSNLQCVKNGYVISQNIKMVDEGDQVPVTLYTDTLGDECRLLESSTGTGPECFQDCLIPGEMAYAVE